uniref:Uncharacterized protein n=1 Tax=Opuntia streptacantha TaxID=393608 RepID=A0A7C9E9H9_OPUST
MDFGYFPSYNTSPRIAKNRRSLFKKLMKLVWRNKEYLCCSLIGREQESFSSRCSMLREKSNKSEFISRQPRSRKCSNQSRRPRDRNYINFSFNAELCQFCSGITDARHPSISN